MERAERKKLSTTWLTKKQILDSRRLPFTIAAYNISEINLGNLVRTAHCFTVQEIIFIGEKPRYAGDRGSLVWENLKHINTVDEFLLYTKDKNLVSVELDPNAIDIREIKCYPDNPIFILGTEIQGNGVPKEIINKSKLIVKIPQFGYVPCLNVATAGAIIMYDWIVKTLK